MDKKKNDNTPLEKTGSYLRTQRIRGWIVVLAAMIFAAGVLAWLFFGSCSITVTGYAYVYGGVDTVCFVSPGDIDKVKPGMAVWVDNTKGTVTQIKDNYYTYDQLRLMYGNTVRNLHMNEDDVCYSVNTDIVKELSEVGRFTIITDTVAPFFYYFGGADK